MRVTRLLGATALSGALAILPAQAFAAETPAAVAAPVQTGVPAEGAQNEVDAQDAPGENDTTEQTDVVVTGSRIRSPNLESTSPVSVVSGEELFETGQVAVGDLLNDLPQLRSTFSQQNSTQFLGTRGLNLLDLRGLGTQRTLVLQNGRRHVAADILNNAVSPDTNTFPTDLIERIDVLSGGGSAVYGSDAIAGVVNFILKDDFDGLQLRAQNGVSAKYNDAGSQYVSVLAGKNFAEGRGNIAVNLEFAHQERFFASGRPNLRQNNGFVVVDTDPAGSVNGSDGNPDRLFFRDIRSSTISLGGQLGLAQSRANPRCGADNTGAPFTCGFFFNPDGSLSGQTGARVGLAPNGSFIGGNGYSGREGQLLALTPDLKRYSANLIGHFDFSPAATLFVEAKYVRTDAFGSQSGPFFNQGINLENSPGLARDRVRLDNPYLSAANRLALTTEILGTGVDPNSTGTTPAALTAAQLAQVANGSFRLNLRRNFLELGIRDEQIRRETYRGVIGLRGDFNDDWNYEISANYGEFREKNLIEGNVNRQRYLLAVDTTRNAAGQIVCRSQVDPAAAGVDRAPVPNAANLAADVAACVPLNPFGDGNISQEAENYLRVPSRAEGKITQFVASAFVGGDLSQLFELPGGPIGFSVGAEYRKETNFYDLDDFTQAGYAFYNAIQTFNPPSFEVKEVFGEINIPLVKDLPLLRELTIKGQGRIADYKGSTGTVYAYGGGVDWRPIQDLRLRGTYQRSVRAPNLNELFSAAGQNFAPAPNDPCSARNLATGSANRVANCNAAGRPANYDFVYTSSLEIVSGGNPNLREEKSDSYTGGFVFTPSFIPGLSISADYFDITVDNVITAVSAQNILNLCYDSPTLDNAFCGLFTRAGAGGGPRGEQAFRVLEGSLLQSTLNFARLEATGVDTNIGYRRTIGPAQVSLNGIWTRTIKRNNFTNPANPDFKNRILQELGDPKNQVNVNASAKIGPLTVGYQLRWIDKMFLNTAENYIGINGENPQNNDYASVKFYPDVFYHDARVEFGASERFNIYLGVDNLANRQPPFGLTGIGDGSGIYDNRGRYIYTGVRATF